MLDLIACLGILSLFGGVAVAIAVLGSKPQPKPRGRKAMRLNHWL